MENQWKKKEKKDAKRFDGKRVKGSGNTWFRTGDIKSDTFLVEAKTTKRKSFTISDKLWNDIARKAIFQQGNTPRIPILSIELGTKTELVVLDINDFLSITKISSLDSER